MTLTPELKSAIILALNEADAAHSELDNDYARNRIQDEALRHYELAKQCRALIKQLEAK